MAATTSCYNISLLFLVIFDERWLTLARRPSGLDRLAHFSELGLL